MTTKPTPSQRADDLISGLKSLTDHAPWSIRDDVLGLLELAKCLKDDLQPAQSSIRIVSRRDGRLLKPLGID